MVKCAPCSFFSPFLKFGEQISQILVLSTCIEINQHPTSAPRSPFSLSITSPILKSDSSIPLITHHGLSSFVLLLPQFQQLFNSIDILKSWANHPFTGQKILVCLLPFKFHGPSLKSSFTYAPNSHLPTLPTMYSVNKTPIPVKLNVLPPPCLHPNEQLTARDNHTILSTNLI